MTQQHYLPDWQEYFGPDWTFADHAARFPNSVRDATPPSSEVATSAPHGTARVNGGCWVVSCPQEGCRGVEFARFHDGLFFCCECRNAGVGHRLVPVDLPDDATRKAVEAILVLRPVPSTRNWTPGETLDALKAENLLHGIGLP